MVKIQHQPILRLNGNFLPISLTKREFCQKVFQLDHS
jgi:hypothetical protein